MKLASQNCVLKPPQHCDDCSKTQRKSVLEDYIPTLAADLSIQHCLSYLKNLQVIL